MAKQHYGFIYIATTLSTTEYLSLRSDNLQSQEALCGKTWSAEVEILDAGRVFTEPRGKLKLGYLGEWLHVLIH